MTDPFAYSLLLVAILIGVAGQLFLKYGMSKTLVADERSQIMRALNGFVMAGFFCYGCSALLYFSVLGRIDLSVAYPSVSIGYVLVIIASRILFGEQVSLSRWVAVAIICVGVVVVGVA